jgi:hypothetical protein
MVDLMSLDPNSFFNVYDPPVIIRPGSLAVGYNGRHLH